MRSAYAAIVEQDHKPTLVLSESVGLTLKNHVSHETSLHETTDAGFDSDVSRETLVRDFGEALQQVRAQERERAVTLVGPHRDDVQFGLNSLPVKGFASHGETWSYVLSLRLALATLLREESVSGDPVIMLDDVFAELDSRRRHALMRAVSNFEQVIVTAAVAEDVPAGEWNEIRVTAGTVSQDDS